MPGHCLQAQFHDPGMGFTALEESGDYKNTVRIIDEPDYTVELDPSAPEADVKRTAKEALKIYGRIDVLVDILNPVLWKSSDIHAQYQTNVFGPIVIIQALLPSFHAQGYGHILNISSMAGFVRQSFIGAYNSSKAALDSFSETLALEVAPFGVLHTIVASALPTNVLVAAAKKASDGRVGLSGS
ncbi:hypothetical protein BGW80DRAFT_1444040 [Lactifluus volemus]|nr:hypothetical protein BGW80DRAFT_1444040 [Lactifluus volemus]